MPDYAQMTRAELIAALAELEAQLKEHEGALHCVVEQSSEGIVLIDRDGRVVEWNKSEEDITGLPRAHALGRPLWEIQAQFAPDEASSSALVEANRKRITLALQEERANWFNRFVTTPLRCPDGTRRIVESFAYPIRIGSQFMIGSVSRDITGRRAAEQALYDSERKYRQLFEELSIGCALHEMVYDDDGRPVDYVTLEVNAEYERLLGIRREDIVGRRVYEFFPHLDRAWLDIFGAVVATGEPRRYVQYSSNFDKWFQGSAFCPRERQFCATFMDVTEQKRAERNLRQSEERLRRAQQIGHMGSFHQDLATNTPWWSDQVYRILGVDPSKQAPSFGLFRSLIHPDDRAMWESVMQRAMASGSADAEYRIVRPDGAVRTLRELTAVTVGPDGNLLEVNGTVQDITERKEAEEGLSMLSRAVAVSPVSIVITSPSGIIEYVNPRFTTNTGYEAAEVLGKNLSLLGSEGTSPDDYRRMVETVAAGATWQGLFHNRKKSGELYWESTSVSPILDSEGTATHLVSIGEDITARKQSEELLRESEERFRMLTAVSPAGIYVTDAAGLCQYVNDRWCEMTGMTPGEALGEGWLNALYSRDRARVASGWRHVVESRGPWQGEFRYQKTNGGVIWVVGQSAELRDGTGTIVGYIGTVTDITERKKAEEELRRRNQDLVTLNAMITRIGHARTLQDILNAMMDVVLTVTRKEEGIILLLDEDTGAPLPGIHRGLADPRLSVVRDACHASSLVKQALQTGHTASAPVPGPVDRVADVPTIAVPIRSKDRVVGVLVLLGMKGRVLDAQNEHLLTMIGDQVGVALENTRLAEKVAVIEVWREIDRLRSELVANVSHELRTPLGLIKLFSSALVGPDLKLDTRTREQFLTDIVEEADKLTQIVDNLLDIARQQNNRLRLNQLPIDLGQLIRDVTKTMQVQLVKHHFVYESPAEPLVAEIDRLSIEQVLRNLISNAIKYSPNGGPITITLSQSSHQAIIQVGDTGIGIPPEELERVFERFYRVASQSTPTVTGIGLGLSVSRGIVEAHGGRMWAESKVGAGSSFFVSLPCEPRPSAP